MLSVLVLGGLLFSLVTVAGVRVERSGPLSDTLGARVGLGLLLVLISVGTIYGFLFAAFASVSWE